MNGFDSARGVETQGNSIILPYLKELSDGRLVLTDKGTLSKWLQKCLGDAVVNIRDRVYAVELKHEAKHTKNLFIEIWSNRNLEDRASHAERGQTTGWLMHLKSDLLLYYFLDKDFLYSIDLFELKRWIFGHGDSFGRWGTGSLRHALQRRYSQRNDTIGLLVPCKLLWEELPVGAFRWTRVKQYELLESGRAAA